MFSLAPTIGSENVSPTGHVACLCRTFVMQSIHFDWIHSGNAQNNCRGAAFRRALEKMRTRRAGVSTGLAFPPTPQTRLRATQHLHLRWGRLVQRPAPSPWRLL